MKEPLLMKKLFAAALCAASAFALNVGAVTLADPAAPIPAARLAFGVSYDLGAYSLTNREVPSILNRYQAQISYAPFSFINFGVDGGVGQMDVAGDTTAADTFSVFHGGYGFSGGVHLKLSTPYFYNNLLCAIGIVHGGIFSSKSSASVLYGGTDAAGALGLQFHVQNFGFVTIGSEIYLIEGKNTDYAGSKGSYSNVNNVRGWLAVDYFPSDKLNNKNTFYVSAELTVSPKVSFNGKAPVEEMSFSVSIGAITPRLYGEQSEVEWKP
jgi:hypothetical protein